MTHSISITRWHLYACAIAVVAVVAGTAIALDRRRANEQAETTRMFVQLSARLEALEHGRNRPKLPALLRRDLHDMEKSPPSGNGLARVAGRGLLGESGPALGDAGDEHSIDPRTIASELDALHARDPYDRAGTAVEARIEAFAAEPALIQSKLVPNALQTSCRATRCRIAASFRRAGDAQDWATMLTTLSASQLSYARIVEIPQPDGSAEVRIYGARR